ncbi:MAG TPA: multidrug effflux MFS transporter [Actinomycetales bacterium]|jgi:DHA1 family bicyclomycin/chloramphenicol resistance-like MFS transporter
MHQTAAPVRARTTTGATAGAALTVPLGLVVLLACMRGLGPLSLDTYLPALPAIAADLSASTSATQLTLTATLAGLAIGQLVFGPLSDAHGRRRPLLAGITLFVLAAVGCALAPSIGALVVARFALGLAGAAGMVTAMAVARDSSDGNAMARLLAALMLVTGVVPLIAPVVGGQLLRLTSWRGIFAMLAVAGVVILLTTWRRVPETLSVRDRQPVGLRPTLRTLRMLVRDKSFALPALTLVLASAGLFGYLSGSPFLLQGIHDLSPQAFSGVFAANTIGLTVLGQVSGRIVHRTGAGALLLAGTLIIAAGGLTLLAATLVGAGLPVVLVALALVVGGMGLVFPNATTLGLAEHGATAGSASALMGLGQFAAGAVAAPLVGLGPDHSVSMAVVIAAATSASVVTAALAVRQRRSALATAG